MIKRNKNQEKYSN